jgi:hypothetical protein
MAQKNENWLAWALAAFGIAGAGFAAGLHRLIWTLFWVIAAIWILLCWIGGSKERDETTVLVWWLLAIGPTLVVAILLRTLEGIVIALSSSISSQNGPQQK